MDAAHKMHDNFGMMDRRLPAMTRESETRGVPFTLGGADDFVAAWVARQLGIEREDLGLCAGLGIVLDDRLIGGVVYNEYRKLKRGASMQIGIATATPRWATRRVLRDVFVYPFGQMQVSRLWAGVARNNKKSRSLVERLGFRMEGVARRAHDGVRDSVIYSMLPTECRWT